MNTYFTAVASFLGTITHGMLTGAATGRYVETVVRAFQIASSSELCF
jgi:acyl dehydratase